MSKTIDTVIDNLVTDVKDLLDFGADLAKDADSYVGGQGTVRYFQLTPEGKPRFPVTVALYQGERDV